MKQKNVSKWHHNCDMLTQYTSESSYTEFLSTTKSINKQGSDRTSISKRWPYWGLKTLEQKWTGLSWTEGEKKSKESREGTSVGKKEAQRQLCGHYGRQVDTMALKFSAWSLPVNRLQPSTFVANWLTTPSLCTVWDRTQPPANEADPSVGRERPLRHV